MIPNYNDPRVTLKQVYKGVVSSQTALLGACVIGPHYLVRKYEDLGAQIKLGTYDIESGSLTGLLPGLTGKQSKIDQKSIAIYMPDALVKTAQFTDIQITDGNTIKVKDQGVSFNFAELNDTIILTVDGSQITTRIAKFVKDSQTGITNTIISDKVFSSETSATKLTLTKKVSAYLNPTCVTFDASTNRVSISNASMTLALDSTSAATADYTVIYGIAYCEYRARSSEYTKRYGMLAGQGSVQDVLGKVCAQNPLAIAVAAAASNAQNNVVFFVSVDVQDDASSQQLVKAYMNAVDLTGAVEGCYGIVPCTADAGVLKALLGYANAKSAEQIPHFKYLYGSADIPTSVKVLQKAVVKTVQGNKVTFQNNALLNITRNIIGDTLYISQQKQFTIIDTNYVNSITIEAGQVSVADICSVIHNVQDTGDAISTIVANKAISDKRGVLVIADNAMYKGQLVPNYVVAAAVAGLRSAKEPQAPLSNIILKNITTDDASGFTQSQSKTLGSNGFWRVGMTSDGLCITRRQLTSAAVGDVNFDQQSIVCTIDAICLVLKNVGKSYVGNSNISQSLLALLRADMITVLSGFTVIRQSHIGPMLISVKLNELAQDPTDKSRIYASISGQPPKPFNQFAITFYMN